MNRVINSFDISKASFIMFEKENLGRCVINDEKKEKFQKVCEMIDFAYKCWEGENISVEVNKNAEVVISIYCIDAMVQNRYFEPGEKIEGLGEIDNTFYEIIDSTNKICFSPTESGISVTFIIPGIWDII